MSVCCFGCLLVVCFFVFVNSKEDIDSALTLAHCRATCIHEIDMSPMTQQRCDGSILCSQCWEVCRRLQSADSKESLCTNDRCTGGCLKACHWVSSSLLPPMLTTIPLEELIIADDTASWPPPPSATPTPVYVVMVDHQLYLQTLDLTASLPLGVDPLTVLVLVVDWRGVSNVFTLRPQTPLEQARTLVRRLGLEKALDFSEALNVTSKQIIVKTPWELKEVSRTYLVDLVKVQISWMPQQSIPTHQLTYMVTWEVEGGMVRGNLVTNSSSTTLSLQLDTIFRIQVALFNLNSSDWESQVLEVDTHKSLVKSHHILHLPSRNSSQLATLLAGTVAILMGVVLVLTWRWQHQISLRHSKLVDIGVPKLYRVFPPAVRLTSVNLDANTEIFSSRDNLLQN